MENNIDDFKLRFEECNTKFDTIFKLTSVPSKVICNDLSILKVNKAVTELLGYSAEEIEGTRIVDYACPEYKQHWLDLQIALWERKLPFLKLEACLIRRDKSIAWVNVTTILFHDKGETYGLSILDDITYRREYEESEKQLKAALARSNQIQEELRSSQQHLTRILDTMAEGVCIIDRNGQLTYANKMAQKILGLNETEIKNRTFYDNQWQNMRLDGTLLPPEEHPMTIMMATGKQIFDHEIAVQPANGELYYVSINAAPIHDEHGNLVGGVGTFMNVTNRRKSIQQKDEFISVASHELRTPITSLKASLQLLNRMPEDKQEERLPALLQKANKSISRVDTLIADLLNATNLTEGSFKLHKTLFKISKLIDECCNHIPLPPDYSIKIEKNYDMEVYADVSRIDQVITNFINNAIKYAPESKEILVRVEKEAEFVKISVIDKGKGIPQEKQQYLFDRYFRVDTSGINYSGLGLGLYINFEIVKKHGGDIGVESEIGKGSKFWFTLPLDDTDKDWTAFI
ncbi:MAG TPA: PAS domain S-box protein [Pedobacter sp.]